MVVRPTDDSEGDTGFIVLPSTPPPPQYTYTTCTFITVLLLAIIVKFLGVPHVDVPPTVATQHSRSASTIAAVAAESATAKWQQAPCTPISSTPYLISVPDPEIPALLQHLHRCDQLSAVVDGTNAAGASWAHLAVSLPIPEAVATVRVLAHLGMPLNAQLPGSKITPLHNAAMLVAREQVVAALLEAGADARARAAAGQTPLHGAALLGNEATVALLLRAGADPAALDAAGNSPLHLAAQLANGDTIAALLAAGGADLPGLRDGQGRTALQVLQARHDERTVASLLDRIPALADVQSRATG